MTSRYGPITREAVAEILRGLETIHAEAQQASPNWRNCRTSVLHRDLLNVLEALDSGASYPEPLLRCFASPDSVLASLFFGPMTEAVQVYAPDATAHASDGSRSLRVVLTARGASPESLASATATPRESTVTIATDCTEYHFVYATADKPRPERFLDVNIAELAADVAFVGSIWSSVFPAHRAILTRTVAVSVPRGERGVLFDRRGSLRGWVAALRPGMSPDERREIRALERLRATFGRGDGLELLSLDDLMRRFEGPDSQVETIAERRTGDLVVRSYRAPRSRVVTFDPSAPAPEPKRGDYVLSYQPSGSKKEYFREFVMCVKDWRPEEGELYRAALDILHVLAIRRSGLFRFGFAERVYTVLLPPGLLKMSDYGDQGIVLVPCIILYQAPRKSSFRRTFTISYLAIPVDLEPDGEDETSRPVISCIRGPGITGIEDLRALRRDLKAEVVPGRGSPTSTVHGPLAELLRLGNEALALPTLLQQIGEFISARVIARRTAGVSSVAAAMTLTGTVESTLSTLLLQVDWHVPSGATQPWENWLIEGRDRSFTDNVYKLMFYEDFVDPRSGYTSRRGIDFERILVGNSLRTDMNGMTFFDPTDELKLILYPLHREHYPNYSIVRWMAFSLYSESALCSLQGMIQRFYIDLHRQDDLRRVVETLSEMTESFAELYDLDIRRYLYRQEYERLRELLKVDRDYTFLLEKFGSVKEDASLREQRLFNKLLVAFTVATTSVAIVGTVAQILQWTAERFLTVALPTAVGLTVAGYVAFDRIRRFLSAGR